VRCTPITALVLSSIVLLRSRLEPKSALMSQRLLAMNTCMAKFRLPPVGSLEARAMLSRWQIAIWLNGYYHAKRNNGIINLESLEDNVNKLTNYCYDEKNFEVPLMEAIERVLGK